MLCHKVRVRGSGGVSGSGGTSGAGQRGQRERRTKGRCVDHADAGRIRCAIALKGMQSQEIF